jgi:glutamate synthase (NADPH) large chain
MHNPDLPLPTGLYDPRFEHDACGVSFLVDMRGRASHAIVADAMAALCNLDHRGAVGAEPDTGDGAGILIQMPDRFLREVVGFELPSPGSYASGIAFLPPEVADVAAKAVEAVCDAEGLVVLGWRDVPHEPDVLGRTSRAALPVMRQLFVTHPEKSGLALERAVFVARRRIERDVTQDIARVYFPSFSTRTLVYKGMLTTPQLSAFYPDLRDERVESALALIHSRFSTNTFPSWPLAHPYRVLAHNGEINTVQGNENWMRARA